MSTTHETNVLLLQTKSDLRNKDDISLFDRFCGVIRRSNCYYWLRGNFATPFEAFYVSTPANATKSRILPIIEPRAEPWLKLLFRDVNEISLFVTLNVSFFVSSFDSLAQQQRMTNAPPSADAILQPLFNFEEQFFSFVRYASAPEYDSDIFAAYTKPPADVSEGFARVCGLASGREMTFALSELIMFKRCDHCDFLLEKLYLCSKIMHNFNALPGARDAGLSLLKPELSELSAKGWEGFIEELSVLEKAPCHKITEFGFFCAQTDVTVAPTILHRLIETFARLGCSQVLPKCFYVETNSGKTPAHSLEESLINKADPERRLVFVMGGNAFTEDDLREAKGTYKLQGQKNLFLPQTIVLDALQERLWRFQRMNRSFSRMSDIKSGLMCICLRQRRSRGFKLTSFDLRGGELHRQSVVAENDSAMTSAIAQLTHGNPAALLFRDGVPAIQETLPEIMKVGCREIGLQLFLNVRKAMGFDDIRINFQTFRSYIAFESFFKDVNIERLYEYAFLPIVGAQELLLIGSRESWVLDLGEKAPATLGVELARTLLAVHTVYFPLHKFMG